MARSSSASFLAVVGEVEAPTAVGVNPGPGGGGQMGVGQQGGERGEAGIVVGGSVLEALRPGEESRVGGVAGCLFQGVGPLPQCCHVLSGGMSGLLQSCLKAGCGVCTQLVESLGQTVLAPSGIAPPLRFGHCLLSVGSPGEVGVGEAEVRCCPALGRVGALAAYHACAYHCVILLKVAVAADERLPTQPPP